MDVVDWVAFRTGKVLGARAHDSFEVLQLGQTRVFRKCSDDDDEQ